MDHIPRPPNPAWSLPPVRLYVSPQFRYPAALCYTDYLDHIGWTKEDVQNVRTTTKSRADVHRVLQEWLYFGLLSHLTFSSVGAGHVRAKSTLPSGEPLLCSDWLPKLAKTWLSKLRAASADERESDVQYIYEFLLQADVVCEIIYKQDPRYLDQGFLLSIHLLIDTVNYTIGLSQTRVSHMDLGWPEYLAAQTIIRERMAEAGWCPSKIHMLQKRLRPTEQVFASLLEPLGKGEDHTGCSEAACLAHQLDDSTYVTRHVEPGCTCDFVYAEQKELADVLCSPARSVPVVLPTEPLRRAEDGRLYVRIAPSRDEAGSSMTPYVAISHVWSDGMGNPRENAIPLCVFRRLRDQVSLVRADSPFWLDTLCFPLQPKAAYDRALVEMRQTYKDAESTLVIDAYLTKMNAAPAPTGGISVGGLALRLLCTRWSQRLWTLQEGVLPRHLFFQFADGPVNLTERYRTPHEADLAFTLSFGVVTYLEVRARDMQDLGIEYKSMTITEARNSLMFRSTSDPNDEPLCLGNILGVEPDRIVGVQVEGDEDGTRTRTERMKVIWLSLETYYSDLVFWDMPKMQDEGFRWAPTSLMGGSHAAASAADDRGTTLEPGKGLRVKLPSVRLDCSQGRPPMARRLLLRGSRYLLEWRLREDQVSCSDAHKLVVLLDVELPADEEADPPRKFWWHGNVAEVGQTFTAGDGTDLTMLRSLGLVTIRKVGRLDRHPDWDASWEPGTRTREEVKDAIWDHDGPEIIGGDYTGIQEWCLD